MARDKTKAFIEASCFWPVLVGGELHQTATARAAFGNGPGEYLPAKPIAAPVGGDAHAFNLPAPHPKSRKPWDEAELQAANQAPGIFHHQELIGISADGGEGCYIGRARRVRGVFAPLTQNVIGQKRDDGGQIRRRGASEVQRHRRFRSSRDPARPS